MYFAYILHWNDQNLHRTAWPSHCIFFTINKPFVILKTDKPRLFTVVVFFQHVFSTIQANIASSLLTKTWVSAIHWIFTTAIFLISSFIACHSQCWLLKFLHIFCVATTKTHIAPLDPHIVYCFNINKTIVVLTTDKPRLFTVEFIYIRELLYLHHQPKHR